MLSRCAPISCVMDRADRAATLRLTPRPSFRLDLAVWTLRHHAGDRIDAWADGARRRAFIVDDRRIETAVRQHGDAACAARTSGADA